MALATVAVVALHIGFHQRYTIDAEASRVMEANRIAAEERKKARDARAAPMIEAAVATNCKQGKRQCDLGAIWANP